MEIREGTKFKILEQLQPPGNYCFNIGDEITLRKDKNHWMPGSYKSDSLINAFKSGKYQITYYPYKEGDYCIRTWPSGKKTLGIACRFISTDLYFKSLEDYNGEGGVTKNSIYGLLQEPYAGIYQRPAFKDEIPKESIMNKEELLMEAKRRYPIGTKVRPLNLNTIDEIKNHDISNFIPQDNCVWFKGYKNGLLVYENGKWAEIIENKIENMNDLDKELKERESKLEQSTVNVKWNVVFSEIGAKEVYRTSNNKIKPNLIKHNNSRFQKLLIIRTNKSKYSGKTK